MLALSYTFHVTLWNFYKAGVIILILQTRLRDQMTFLANTKESSDLNCLYL
jgi:hypothetical protein